MNILITCAGRRNYMVDYFRDALKDVGGKVFAANSSEFSTALAISDLGFVLPSIYDPSYIDLLLEICNQHNINTIVPLFDLELPILAQAKERFTKLGISIILSSEQVVNICTDKWQTNIFLNEIGVKHPKTYIELGKIKEDIEDNILDFPIIIKPRWGMGSIGLMEAENMDELSILYSKTLRAIERSYLSTISHGDIDKAVLFQEKLMGQEYGLDVINNLDGEYVITVVKKKIAMRSGETDVAETVDDESLKQLGKKIGIKLGHIANLDMDVFVIDSDTYVLEMNPRFGGGYPFSHLAGINLPKALVDWLHGEQSKRSCFQIEYGVIGLKGLRLFKLNSENFRRVD